MSSLKCSDYDVYVATRGGEDLLCRLAPSAIKWTRTLNDFSTAEIKTKVNQSCRSCLADLNPWEHEVLVFRNSQLVWSGPIMNITYGVEVTLNCRDLLSWTEKRLVELQDQDYEVEEVDLAVVFDWLLSHGYNKDPWTMGWSITETGVPISKFYPGYYSPDRWGGLYPTVANELRSVSQAGIDYTVINRALIAGNLFANPPVDTVLQLADQSWSEVPEIMVSGTKMSTRTGVAGGSGGYWGWQDDQIWFETTNGSYLLETFVSRPDMSDVDTTVLPSPIAQEAAIRNRILSTPLAMISGGQLASSNTYDFNDLIPGLPVMVGMLNPIRPIETDYRLYTLSVTVNESKETTDMGLSSPTLDSVLSE